jgi:hypothetical protein
MPVWARKAGRLPAPIVLDLGGRVARHFPFATETENRGRRTAASEGRIGDRPSPSGGNDGGDVIGRPHRPQRGFYGIDVMNLPSESDHSTGSSTIMTLGPAFGSISLSVVHEFSSPRSMNLSCGHAFVNESTTLNFMRISAVRVASLSNVPSLTHRKR